MTPEVVLGLIILAGEGAWYVVSLAFDLAKTLLASPAMHGLLLVIIIINLATISEKQT